MSDQSAAIESRPASRKASIQRFVKEWEWTWTTAVVFALGATFFILITMVAIPSFFMYFVDKQFHWSGPTDISEAARELTIDREVGLEVWNQVRDIVAMSLTTIPFILFLVIAAAMQNWRQRLRGQAGEKRPTGGYR